MKKIISLLALLYFSTAFAQGELKFKEVVWDFGNVEEGRIAAHDFVCTNAGKDPLVIQSASPSCGCTVSEYTRTPILPAKTGKVTASYNTIGRPGAFNKTITVIANGNQPSIVLTIRGTVIPKSQMPALTKEQMEKTPLLVIDKKEHTVGQIEKGKSVSMELKVKNTGRTELRISSVGSYCQCVNYKITKTPLAPGDSTTMELIYKPNQVGTANEWVSIYSNDVRNPKVGVLLQATVVESLTQQSEVKEEKPKSPFN
jgi:hypothetical protein